MNDYELLYLISQNDRAAEDILLEKYQLLIWKNVNIIFSQYVPQGVERDDLFQEGLISLRKTFDTYDVDMSVPFFSFANLCIRRSMIAYLRKFSTMASKQFYDSLSLDAGISEDVSLYYGDVIFDTTEISALVKYDEKLGDIYLNCTTISEFEKNVLVLQVAGYTYEESGKLLNCSVKKIDNTLQKVKRMLN